MEKWVIVVAVLAALLCCAGLCLALYCCYTQEEEVKYKPVDKCEDPNPGYGNNAPVAYKTQAPVKPTYGQPAAGYGQPAGAAYGGGATQMTHMPAPIVAARPPQPEPIVYGGGVAAGGGSCANHVPQGGRPGPCHNCDGMAYATGPIVVVHRDPRPDGAITASQTGSAYGQQPVMAYNDMPQSSYVM